MSEFLKLRNDVGVGREGVLKDGGQIHLIDTGGAIGWEIGGSRLWSRGDDVLEIAGIAALFFEQSAQTVNCVGGLGGRKIEPTPSGTVSGGAFESGLGLTTDEDRELGALDRFGVTERAFEVDELAGIAGLVAP